ETLQFFKKYCLNDHLYLGVIHPYPGSKIFEYCTDKKIIPDKQRYYETIDERDYNMTSMPNWIWTRWISLLYKQADSYSWVKPVDAPRLLEDKHHSSDKYLLQSGQKVLRVAAICPYCGKESIFSEPIKITNAGQNMGMAPEGVVTISTRIKRAWSRVS